MKKIAAIGLLVLLLYNTLGLTFAVLYFEDNFKVASPLSETDDFKIVKLYLPSLPYSDSWENADGTEGLLQQDGNFYNATHILHKNDTLYVTLKSNQVARDQFFELANMMEMVTDRDGKIPESAQNRALKILDNLLKSYLSNSQKLEFVYFNFTEESVITYQPQINSIYSGCEINLNTPPPEIA